MLTIRTYEKGTSALLYKIVSSSRLTRYMKDTAVCQRYAINSWELKMVNWLKSSSVYRIFHFQRLFFPTINDVGIKRRSILTTIRNVAQGKRAHSWVPMIKGNAWFTSVNSKSQTWIWRVPETLIRRRI